MKTKIDELQAAGDGRNIAPDLGLLGGEASGQRVEHLAERRGQKVSRVPASDADSTTYYGLPVLNEPVWIWSIPAYFYVGGLAGASNLFGAACQAVNRRELEPVIVRARWIGAVGDAVSAALLIHDLGRPMRFLNMLRVFRPTSPMSVGSWVLAVCGAFSAASAVLAQVRGPLGRLGTVAEYGAGIMGIPLAGYTGVLLGCTAVPVWQATRTALPVLFISSGIAASGSLLDLLGMDGRSAEAARRFGIAGKLAELVAGAVVEAQARRVPRVGRVLGRGVAGALWNASRALTTASLAVALLGRRRRWARTASGVLGTAGAVSLRFAVFHAGKASARDPRATFDGQRAGYGAAEVTAAAAEPRVREPSVEIQEAHEAPAPG